MKTDFTRCAKCNSYDTSKLPGMFPENVYDYMCNICDTVCHYNHGETFVIKNKSKNKEIIGPSKPCPCCHTMNTKMTSLTVGIIGRPTKEEFFCRDCSAYWSVDMSEGCWPVTKIFGAPKLENKIPFAGLINPNYDKQSSKWKPASEPPRIPSDESIDVVVEILLRKQRRFAVATYKRGWFHIEPYNDYTFEVLRWTHIPN